MRRFTIEKDKLYDLYVVQHLRMIDIAKIYGFLSVAPVERELKKHGILIRKRGYGFNVYPERKFTEEQYEFFDGLIMSDGSIVIDKKSNHKRANGNGYISCAFKHKEFAQYIKDNLGLKPKVDKRVHKSKRYKSGECVVFATRSHPNIFYTNEKDRWYPKEIKIIPSDFRFTPISMNIAYLSDGSLVNNRHIVICTHSFTRDNLENTFIKHLANIGIYAYIGKNNETKMNPENSKKFLEYIGPCPVNCYKYKWNFNDIVKFVPPTKEELEELYINQKMSARKISKVLGKTRIDSYLRRYNIPTRTFSQSMYLYHQQKGKPK